MAKQANIQTLSCCRQKQKSESWKLKAETATANNVDKRDGAATGGPKNKWLKTVMIIDALYVLIMCQENIYTQIYFKG